MKIRLFIAALSVLILSLGTSFSASAHRGHKHREHCNKCCREGYCAYDNESYHRHYHGYHKHHGHHYDHCHMCYDKSEGNRHRHYSAHSHRW